MWKYTQLEMERRKRYLEEHDILSYGRCVEKNHFLLKSSVESVTELFQEKDGTAGIPASVPIRVTVNGWPAGKNPVANIERT
jgi:hypothetical protein